jgi:predicted MFS family arabinose efflux permease
LLVPLPRYLAAVGFADWQIGLVLGAFGVASLISRPLFGGVVDRFGARRTMLVGSVSLALGALGVTTTASLSVLLVLRVLQAIGYVAFTTASTALVVVLVAPHERASRLATFGAAASVAISLTPAAITALLQVAPVDAGLLPIAVTEPGLSSRRMEWLIPRRVWLPMLLTALLGAGFAAFFQFAPILAERRGAAPGVLYGVYGAAIIATRFLAGRLLDRFATGRVVAVAAALMAFGHALIASTHAPTPLLPAAALIATSGGLFHPTLIAHHTKLLSEAPGRASAAFYAAFDLGIGIGSWLLGTALQLTGLPGLYWTAAALAVAAVPLALLRLDPHGGRAAVGSPVSRTGAP